MPEDVQERLRPIPVLNTGSCHHHREDQPEGIDEEMPLAALDLFAHRSRGPPFFGGLDRLTVEDPSTGLAALAGRHPTSPRSRSYIRCQVPSCRQRQQYW